MLVHSIEITVWSGVGDKILRSNDSLKWPIVVRPFTSSQDLLDHSYPNLVCSICRVNIQEIVNCMTSTKRGCYSRGKSVKLMYFFTKSSSILQIIVRINYVYSSDDIEKSTKIVGRGSCAQAWSCKSFSETHYFIKKKASSLIRVMVQTNYVKNNGKQVRVYRTCVSWSQGQGFCAKVWQYKSCSEIALFL